jgi:hypothetical protein
MWSPTQKNRIPSSLHGDFGQSSGGCISIGYAHPDSPMQCQMSSWSCHPSLKQTFVLHELLNQFRALAVGCLLASRDAPEAVETRVWPFKYGHD